MKTTEELKNELKSIQTSENFIRWLDSNKREALNFCDYFREIWDKNNVKISRLEKEVAVSRSYIYAVRNGDKNPEKDIVLKLAIGIGATVEETNRVLKLSGNTELYPKIEEDAIIEFGIRQHWSGYQIEELLKKRGLAANLTDEGKDGK